MPTKLVLISRESGEVRGQIEIVGGDLVPSNVFARTAIQDAERRGLSTRPRVDFLRRLHADLRSDRHVSAGLIPYRPEVRKSRRRSTMLEQLYLQDLGWHGVSRGGRVAYWVRPEDDPRDSVQRFSHEEAVALARLPSDPDELESWAAPYEPVQFDNEPAHSEEPAEASANDTETDSLVRPRRRLVSLGPAERRAVEERAVAVASELLNSEGWTVRDVGATHSYDLHCTRSDGTLLLAEVKGTTQPLREIVLTANEVEVAQRYHPSTALFVVHGITLTTGENGPQATGGLIHEERPWRPDPDRLRPTTYAYRL
ncbi:MAG: DUF3883 domain-containing protein [Solirubrobacteraceae bacterium]